MHNFLSVMTCIIFQQDQPNRALFLVENHYSITTEMINMQMKCIYSGRYRDSIIKKMKKEINWKE
jgi:hypothetical protein